MDYIKTKDDFSMFKYDGIQAMRLGRLDYAMECFERALAIQDDVETHQFYANALISTDDIEGAIEELELIRRAEPENTENLMLLAELCFQTEDYDRTEQFCDEALGIDSTLSAPHHTLARKAFAQGDLINAVAQSTMAITAREDYYDAYLFRATVLHAMGQDCEAEKDIDVVLSHNEESDETTLLKAQIEEGLGKDKEAEEYFRKTIDLNPFSSDAYLRLGALMMRLGRKKEAEELAKEAMEYAPQAMNGINGNYTNWEEAVKGNNPFA